MRTAEDVWEELEELAEWFDSPNECPYSVVLEVRGERLTPGYLLRRIRDRLGEELRPREEWSE